MALVPGGSRRIVGAIACAISMAACGSDRPLDETDSVEETSEDVASSSSSTVVVERAPTAKAQSSNVPVVASPPPEPDYTSPSRNSGTSVNLDALPKLAAAGELKGKHVTIGGVVADVSRNQDGHQVLTIASNSRRTMVVAYPTERQSFVAKQGVLLDCTGDIEKGRPILRNCTRVQPSCISR